MKKKFFSAAAVVTALFAGYSAYNAQNSITLDEATLANVEALADESDECIETNICYMPVFGSTQSSHKLFCNSSTDDTHIYSCPSSKSFDGYSEYQKDRCIKRN